MNHAMNRPAAQVQHLLWAYSLYTYIYIYITCKTWQSKAFCDLVQIHWQFLRMMRMMRVKMMWTTVVMLQAQVMDQACKHACCNENA